MGNTNTLNTWERVCISIGFTPNAGTIKETKQAIAVMILNWHELVSKVSDWQYATSKGAINKQGKIEDRSALRAPKKKIVTPHFLAIGSKVLAMSSNCVTFFPP